MAAVDMMCLLVEVALPMRQLYPSMPVRVLEAICYAIAIFTTEEQEQQVSWVDKVRISFSKLSNFYSGASVPIPTCDAEVLSPCR